jgi:hypothetical protein
MTLVLLALAAGVVVGYARGGGVGRLAALRPRRNRLLLTAVGLHALGVLGGWLWEPALPTLVGLSWAVLGYYAWVNRAIQGAALVAVGLLANAAVLLANGAVPVSADAAARAGAEPSEAVSSGQYEIADADTRLAWLGKVVPVAFPPRPEVVTPGDVAVAAGLGLVVGVGLTGRRHPPHRLEDGSETDRRPGHDDAEVPGHETMHDEAERHRSAVV